MADEKIVRFRPVLVSESHRFDPDEILDAARGQKFSRMVILGEYSDDSPMWVSGNCNAGEALILMEVAKQYLVFGDK